MQLIRNIFRERDGQLPNPTYTVFPYFGYTAMQRNMGRLLYRARDGRTWMDGCRLGLVCVASVCRAIKFLYSV